MKPEPLKVIAVVAGCDDEGDSCVPQGGSDRHGGVAAKICVKNHAIYLTCPRADLGDGSTLDATSTTQCP
jgi:hypothetical protein